MVISSAYITKPQDCLVITFLAMTIFCFNSFLESGMPLLTYWLFIKLLQVVAGVASVENVAGGVCAGNATLTGLDKSIKKPLVYKGLSF